MTKGLSGGGNFAGTVVFDMKARIIWIGRERKKYMSGAPALSPSLRFRLRLEWDELEASDDGTDGGSIAFAGGG